MINFILQFRINFGMGFLGALVTVGLLYVITRFINNSLSEDNQIPKIINNRSTLVSCLIILGIIVGIRYIIELLDYYSIVFEYINNDVLFFAVALTIFFPLHNRFLKNSYSLFRVHQDISSIEFPCSKDTSYLYQ